MDAPRVEHSGVVGKKHLAEAVDGTQRRAKVMRDGVRERLQLPVRPGQLPPLRFQLPRAHFQLARAVCHALLQVDAGRFDLRVLPLDLRQHLVERVHELLDLGRASHNGSADGVILPMRHRRGQSRQAEDRSGNVPLGQL